MIIQLIEGFTRIVGRSQGYLGLPLRDSIMHCNVEGGPVPVMVTAWEPTPDELERIKAGAPVLVSIYGKMHPPIGVEVGATPDADNPYVKYE